MRDPFPDPPNWVPQPLPEVPINYKPRCGDLLQWLDGTLAVIEENWTLQEDLLEGVVRVLALNEPLPLTVTINIDGVTIVGEGEVRNDVDCLVVPSSFPLRYYIGRRYDGAATTKHIRIDRPYTITGGNHA